MQSRQFFTDSLGGFKEDLKKGYVDELIVDLVLTLNNIGMYTTTSSCSGRIIFLCFETLEKKYGSKRHSYHKIPSKKALLDTMRDVCVSCKGVAVVKVKGFIIDLKVPVNDTNAIMRNLALKVATVKPLKQRDKLLVEIGSTVSLNMPLLCNRHEEYYKIISMYFWRNLIDLNVFRNILWYTTSTMGDDEATLK